MQKAIEFQVRWQCKFVSKWDQSFWRSHAPQYYRIYGMSTIGWVPCKIPLLSLKCWCGPTLGSKSWYQPHQEWLTLLLHCLRKLRACQSVSVKVWKWFFFFVKSNVFAYIESKLATTNRHSTRTHQSTNILNSLIVEDPFSSDWTCSTISQCCSHYSIWFAIHFQTTQLKLDSWKFSSNL